MRILADFRLLLSATCLTVYCQCIQNNFSYWTVLSPISCVKVSKVSWICIDQVQVQSKSNFKLPSWHLECLYILSTAHWPLYHVSVTRSLLTDLFIMSQWLTHCFLASLSCHCSLTSLSCLSDSFTAHWPFYHVSVTRSLLTDLFIMFQWLVHCSLTSLSCLSDSLTAYWSLCHVYVTCSLLAGLLFMPAWLAYCSLASFSCLRDMLIACWPLFLA